jgi:hypothetical protein
MSGPLIKMLGQLAVVGASVFGRAFVTAYQQAIQNAKKGGPAAAEAARSAGVMKSGMDRGQALGILNLTEAEANPQAVAKQYKR